MTCIPRHFEYTFANRHKLQGKICAGFVIMGFVIGTLYRNGFAPRYFLENHLFYHRSFQSNQIQNVHGLKILPVFLII